jgi:hypothetical protein
MRKFSPVVDTELPAEVHLVVHAAGGGALGVIDEAVVLAEGRAERVQLATLFTPREVDAAAAIDVIEP